jgi:glycosyltransferase involved in cell wall biosynthesis
MLMRILISTDAWRPQINGVVRTLEALAGRLEEQGSIVEFLTPEGLPSIPVPTYPGLRCAVPNRAEIGRRIEAFRPDAIHIATEGPMGLAVRQYCLRRKLAFTTSFTTRFAEYVSARLPVVPLSWGYAILRRFHAPAAATMVSTASLMSELEARGFGHLRFWTRGVDTELFRPDAAARLDLPRPVFMSVGRIAVEKNLEAFLSLDLPGTKVVIGDGPQEAVLKAKYPRAVFLGSLTGSNLAAHIAAADVFVFPSKTDTFGIVQLEALSCGVPVAAFPVTGPRDVIGEAPVGVLDSDLRTACIGALSIPREECRAHALRYSWHESARQFLSNTRPVRPAAVATGTAPVTSPRTSQIAAQLNREAGQG